MILYLLLFCLCFVVYRLISVYYTTVNGKRKKPRRSSKEMVKAVIVIGSGGHTTEMLYIVEALNPMRYCPRIYVMASSDAWSEKQIHLCEEGFAAKAFKNSYEIVKIPRSRSVHQSYLTSIITTLYSIVASFPIMLRYNPDIVLCNGPGTCVPICFIAFLIRCAYLSDNMIVFVESVCRVKTLSLTGKILQWFADEIFVQWPELISKCSRAKYLGRVA